MFLRRDIHLRNSRMILSRTQFNCVAGGRINTIFYIYGILSYTCHWSCFPLTSELVPFFVSKHNLHLLILKLRIFLLSIEIFLTFKERNPHWDKNNAIHSSFNLLRKMAYSEIFAKKRKKKKIRNKISKLNTRNLWKFK